MLKTLHLKFNEDADICVDTWIVTNIRTCTGGPAMICDTLSDVFPVADTAESLDLCVADKDPERDDAKRVYLARDDCQGWSWSYDRDVDGDNIFGPGIDEEIDKWFDYDSDDYNPAFTEVWVYVDNVKERREDDSSA